MCICCKHAGKLGPFAGICCYLITENKQLFRPSKIESWHRSSKSARQPS